MNVNVAIIYHSITGNNYRLSLIAQNVLEANGAEVRLAKVPELIPPERLQGNEAWKAYQQEASHIPLATIEDMEWADALVFSTPTRHGNVAGQMKMFLDTLPPSAIGRVADRVVTVMTSAGHTHGGQESTLLSFYHSLQHWGAIVIAPGFTDASVVNAGGNPYGTSVNASTDAISEVDKKAAEYQALRILKFTRWIKIGRDTDSQPFVPSLP